MSETESLTLPKVAEDLKPAPYNPRSITRVALKKLAQSLNEYGDLSGIVFNARTGCLVGAHQRLRVLPDGAQIHYGSDRPDDRGEVWGSIRAKGQTFSVRVVDWDLDKEKKANIIANTRPYREATTPMLWQTCSETASTLAMLGSSSRTWSMPGLPRISCRTSWAAPECRMMH